MARSTVEFRRWQAHEPSTWSLQVFNRYDNELGILRTAHIGALEHTYRSLKASGAKWTDNAKIALGSQDRFFDFFKNLRHWSDNYNLFDNWVNLSTVLTVASNLETYMAAVVALAIESDPGVIIGKTRVVDGASLLKGANSKLDVKSQVMSCTRGEWSSRLGAMERLFGPLPSAVPNSQADLEVMQQIRNRFGHAFGRDIDAARDHGLREFIPMETVVRDRAGRIKDAVSRMVKELDKHLLDNHIGDFEPVRFYARHQLAKEHTFPFDLRAAALKKSIGKIGAVPRGKLYRRGLIFYWDSL